MLGEYGKTGKSRDFDFGQNFRLTVATAATSHFERICASGHKNGSSGHFATPKFAVDDIAWKLNSRPRKWLGWKCPAELFLPEDVFDFKAYWADKLNLVLLGH